MKKFIRSRWGKVTLMGMVFALIVGSFLVYSLMPAQKVQAVDATKSQGELMDWTLLDDTAGTMFLETSVLDAGEGYDASLSTVLHITMAHCSTDAAGDPAGFKVFVRVNSDDEGWRFLVGIGATGGVAVAGDLDDAAAGAQAVIPITSTTGFETPGSVFFLHDAGTMANSALVIFGGDYENDVSITVIDDLVNSYDSDDYLYDIVDQWPVLLPEGCDEAKVLFYNTDADSNYACRVDYCILDDIE